MKQIPFYLSRFFLLMAVACALCSCGQKANVANDIDKTKQGQGGGDNRTPAQKLKEFCDSKPGSTFFPAPRLTCRYLVASFLPKQDVLDQITEPVSLPIYELPGLAYMLATKGEGFVEIWRVSPPKSRMFTVPDATEPPSWSPLPEGKYEAIIYPGSAKVKAYVMACYDVNQHYTSMDQCG